MDCSTERGQAIRLANPEVIDASDEMFTFEEASPNLPGVSAKLKRPARVTVRYLDAEGVETTRDFNERWSTSVQHQIDHLNGLLYVDRLSRTRRHMVLKKVKM